MIKINLISKSYEGQTVLQDIKLEFQKGEVHGLVGENGAGKTTLLNASPVWRILRG